MSTWNYKRFGTAADPIRQSALMSFASQEGCGKRYRYERDAEARGEDREKGTTVAYHPVLGTAVHETIRRALRHESMAAAVIAGKLPSHERIDGVLAEEMEREAAGRTIDWRDASRDAEMVSARWMVLGALRSVYERAARILAVEAPFIVELDSYTATGTIDLVYEPRDAEPGTRVICMADWKTGGRPLPKVLLDRGYQVSIYAEALEHGLLWPGTERETRMGIAPRDIHIVHLRAYAQHERAAAVLAAVRETTGTAEELTVIVARKGWQVSQRSVSAVLTSLAKRDLVEKKRNGKQTMWMPGPSTEPLRSSEVWYASRRQPGDGARLRVSLRTIVGTVRMGRFVESYGEQCQRCPFAQQCTGEGYGPDTETARALEDALDGIDAGIGIPDVA